MHIYIYICMNIYNYIYIHCSPPNIYMLGCTPGKTTSEHRVLSMHWRKHNYDFIHTYKALTKNMWTYAEETFLRSKTIGFLQFFLFTAIHWVCLLPSFLARLYHVFVDQHDSTLHPPREKQLTLAWTYSLGFSWSWNDSILQLTII